MDTRGDMESDTKRFIVAGALSMVLAIGLGAFGAHALKSLISPDKLEVFHTAVRYHLLHSVGLFAVSFVCFLKPGSSLARASGWVMLAGMVVFCGSLYVMVLTGHGWLGAITPIGGVALMTAWLLVAMAALKK